MDEISPPTAPPTVDAAPVVPDAPVVAVAAPLATSASARPDAPIVAGLPSDRHPRGRMLGAALVIATAAPFLTIFGGLAGASLASAFEAGTLLAMVAFSVVGVVQIGTSLRLGRTGVPRLVRLAFAFAPLIVTSFAAPHGARLREATLASENGSASCAAMLWIALGLSGALVAYTGWTNAIALDEHDASEPDDEAPFLVLVTGAAAPFAILALHLMLGVRPGAGELALCLYAPLAVRLARAAGRHATADRERAETVVIAGMVAAFLFALGTSEVFRVFALRTHALDATARAWGRPRPLLALVDGVIACAPFFALLKFAKRPPLIRGGAVGYGLVLVGVAFACTLPFEDVMATTLEHRSVRDFGSSVGR